MSGIEVCINVPYEYYQIMIISLEEWLWQYCVWVLPTGKAYIQILYGGDQPICSKKNDTENQENRFPLYPL